MFIYVKSVKKKQKSFVSFIRQMQNVTIIIIISSLYDYYMIE